MEGDWYYNRMRGKRYHAAPSKYLNDARVDLPHELRLRRGVHADALEQDLGYRGRVVRELLANETEAPRRGLMNLYNQEIRRNIITPK